MDTIGAFLEITKTLQNAGVPYFTTTVTQSSMEMPASFVRDHGRSMKPAAILRLGSATKEWPVKIQICYSVRFRVRFCSLWRVFTAGNGLQKGDELIVSLVAVSEFVVYAFRKNLSPTRFPRAFRLPDRASPSSVGFLPDSNGDALPDVKISTDHPLPDAFTPRNSSRVSPSTLSIPRVKEEVQEGDVSVKFESRMDETERHVHVSDRSFRGASYFHKRLSAASTEHFGSPQLARLEIPANFARHHSRLFGEDAVITLEGPTPGTMSEVVCRHKQRRTMWRQGWPNFVMRNELKKGDILEFSLIAPRRFSVRLPNWRRHDSPSGVQNGNNSRKEREEHTQRGEASNKLPARIPNSIAAAILQNKPNFTKTLPATSDAELTAYPYFVIPSTFWHLVPLPPEVNLQGPQSGEIFSVKCTVSGATKTLSRGWRNYAKCNAVRVGDTLFFTYLSESQLFVVDIV